MRDGLRLVALLERGEVTLTSRNGLVVNDRDPRVAHKLVQANASAIAPRSRSFPSFVMKPGREVDRAKAVKPAERRTMAPPLDPTFPVATIRW